MYDSFYNLQAEPFRLSPDHRFCYEHKDYTRARAYMAYAFMRAEGFVMITGRPGTGKTTLIGELIDSLAADNVSTANLVCTQLGADDLLKTVAYNFGISADGADKAELLQKLNVLFHRWHRDGRRALLIVDEAQDLSPAAMEELRLLTNIQLDGQPLLQIFLLGQPELRELVLLPEMEQVHQRIVAASHLEGLEADEVEAYILHRLKKVGWRGDPAINRALFPLLHKFSEGVPRRINLICSRLFLHGGVESRHAIDIEDLRVVISELQSEHLAAGARLSEDDFERCGPTEWIPGPPGSVDQRPRGEVRLRAVGEARAPAVERGEVSGPQTGAKKKQQHADLKPAAPRGVDVPAPAGRQGQYDSTRAMGEAPATADLLTPVDADASRSQPGPDEAQQPGPAQPAEGERDPGREPAAEPVRAERAAPGSAPPGGSATARRPLTSRPSTLQTGVPGANGQPQSQPQNKERPVQRRPVTPKRRSTLVAGGVILLLATILGVLVVLLLMPYLDGMGRSPGLPLPRESTATPADTSQAVAGSGAGPSASAPAESAPAGRAAPTGAVVSAQLPAPVRSASAPPEAPAGLLQGQSAPALENTAPAEVQPAERVTMQTAEPISTDSPSTSAQAVEGEAVTEPRVEQNDSPPAKPSRPLAGGDTVTLLVNFRFDSADLTDDALAVLSEAVRVLQSRPGSAATITGFTDRYGDKVYNMQLSRERAEAVEQQLRAGGVDASRLDVRAGGVLGSGGDEPGVDSSGDSDRGRIVQVKIGPRR